MKKKEFLQLWLIKGNDKKFGYVLFFVPKKGIEYKINKEFMKTNWYRH